MKRMLPLLTPKLPQVPDRRDRNSVRTIFERIERQGTERRTNGDRRATPRVAVMLNLELRGDATGGGLRVVSQTHDLSTFGVAIRTGSTPAVGAKVRLRIHLADDVADPLELEGEVLGAFDANGGARVRFLGPPGPQVQRLHRFLK
jgi:hypothetical protein